MKKKFLAPVMAMVFAIGLSFATEKTTADLANDWIKVGNTMQPIEEVECGEGTSTCTVQFEENGTIHTVYDAEDDRLPKQGSGATIKLWEQ